MTKESFPSRKGIRKIFSRKVIGLLIILLVSLLFLTGFYSSTNQNQSISAEEQERFRNEIIEKYVKELEKDGYENITYKTSAIIEFSEKNHIQINMTRQPGESLDDMIIKRYDYYATYYKVVIGEKDYLFKNEDSAKTFIQNINKYDNNKYSIDKIKKLIKNETSQNEINDIIDIKKQEYEKKKAEEEARRRAAEERAKKQQSTTNNSSSSQSVSEMKAYAYSLIIANGWNENDYNAFVQIVNHESGWNPYAKNKSSGAYGLCQSLPANKMAAAGSDYLTNYKTQLNWCLNMYIKNRYGSPSNAWSFWQSHHWY